MIGEPHAIGGAEEEVAFPMHPLAIDDQDDGSSMASADAEGGGLVVAEMHVPALHRPKAIGQDGGEVLAGGAVVQDGRRSGGPQIEIDLEAVTLVGADPVPDGIDCESPLRVLGHDLVKLFPGDREARGLAGGEQLVDPRPTRAVELNANPARVVAQHQGQELADPYTPMV
jgi:hypothetical protein